MSNSKVFPFSSFFLARSLQISSNTTGAIKNQHIWLRVRFFVTLNRISLHTKTIKWAFTVAELTNRIGYRWPLINPAYFSNVAFYVF